MTLTDRGKFVLGILIILAVAGVVTLSHYTLGHPTPRANNVQQLCLDSGGVWQVVSDTCKIN